MISIDKAKETLFQQSTREELKEYCKALGEKFQPAHGDEALRKILCKALGLSIESANPIATVLSQIKSKSDITPPMNLDPEGIWGGRRIRCRVMRPADAHDKDDGTHVFANGSYGGNTKGYPIKYGAVQVIPVPIYNRLLEIEKHRVEREMIGNDEVTSWSSPERVYHVEVIGIEPGTENLPNSLQEWYQLKGPKWLYDLSKLADLQTIAQKLSIDTHTRNAENKKTTPLTVEELRSNISTFLYGVPDVDLEALAA